MRRRSAAWRPPAGNFLRRRPATPSGGEPPVRIRFYCQGIGDCHLLRFSRRANLLDADRLRRPQFGLGGTDTIKAIVDDIRTVTGRLDVVVLTHEHWDHNSGFLSAQGKFKAFSIGEVWAAWTENSKDPQARSSTGRVTRSLLCRGRAPDSTKSKSRAVISQRQEWASLGLVVQLRRERRKGADARVTRSSRWATVASNISSRRTRPSSLPATGPRP